MKERRAYVCYDKDGTLHKRVFLLPDQNDGYVPRCAEHGAMKRQPNTPYRKKDK
jgi:hypothetical protein